MSFNEFRQLRMKTRFVNDVTTDFYHDITIIQHYINLEY